jgi:hypothetical protein
LCLLFISYLEHGKWAVEHFVFHKLVIQVIVIFIRTFSHVSGAFLF